MRQTMENQVFIKIEDYEAVLEQVETLKKKVADAKTMLSHIVELKHQEDAEIESWQHSVEDVETKITSIKSTLFVEKA
jgi:predicted  nucleic acid-binding Zn-ribbon protein